MSKLIHLTSVPGILVDVTIKASTTEHIGECSEWRNMIDSVLLEKDSDT